MQYTIPINEWQLNDAVNLFNEYANSLNISLDWKPAINLVGAGDSFFWGDNGALSVRYIF